MQNITKLATILLLVALLISVFPLTALADDLGTGPQYAISGPSAGISASGKSVTYKGSAIYTTTEASIKLTITLQEKRGSTWYNVDSNSKSATNAKTISCTKTKTVTGGYYYRCKSVFTATSGTKTVYGSEKWVS